MGTRVTVWRGAAIQCRTPGHRPAAQFGVIGYCKRMGRTAAYVRTAAQPCNPSGLSFGTYVRSESPENTDIFGCTSASIPKNPRTRRPAALVTLLQYSRLYLPWLAITASLKLRGFSAVKPFSAQKIWYTSYSSLELMVASAFSRI